MEDLDAVREPVTQILNGGVRPLRESAGILQRRPLGEPQREVAGRQDRRHVVDELEPATDDHGTALWQLRPLRNVGRRSGLTHLQHAPGRALSLRLDLRVEDRLAALTVSRVPTIGGNAPDWRPLADIGPVALASDHEALVHELAKFGLDRRSADVVLLVELALGWKLTSWRPLPGANLGTQLIGQL